MPAKKKTQGAKRGQTFPQLPIDNQQTKYETEKTAALVSAFTPPKNP